MAEACPTCRGVIDLRYSESLHFCGTEPLWGTIHEVPLFEVATFYAGPGKYQTVVYRLAYGKRGIPELMLLSRDGLIREENFEASHEEAEEKHNQIVAQVRRATSG